MSSKILPSAKRALDFLKKPKPLPPTSPCCGGECAFQSCIWYDYAFYISLQNKTKQLEHLIIEVENPPQEPVLSSDNDGSPYCVWYDYFQHQIRYKNALKSLELTLSRN